MNTVALPGKVACLGILVADIVGRPIDALPKRGTLDLVERIELHIGGCAANTGVSLAKLGVPVAVLGKVGRDDLGDYMTSALVRHGVDVRGIVQDANVPTAATMVTVHSDAERSFLHAIGANAAFTAIDVNWEAAQGAAIFHVAGPQLMTRFEGDGLAETLREAKTRGMTTTLDTVMNPASQGWAGIAPCVPYLDWFIPSFDEAAHLMGELDPACLFAELKRRGVHNLAVKMGSAGCLIEGANGGDPVLVPSFPVYAVDTLGAGDAWAAGFLTGLLHGWPLPQTARFANAVGASCVQSLGATTSVKSLGETLALLGN